MIRTRPLLRGAAPALLLLASCGTGPMLEPAPRAESAAGAPAAVASESGVQLTASAAEWPGRYEIRSEVTPLRITMENGGDRPAAFQYANLRLVTPGGATYSALPLYEIEGRGEDAVAVRTYDPVDEPGFYAENYSIAPYYEGIYPTYPVYGDPFYYDFGYSQAYETYFVNVPLPTPEMRRQALPEGVLEPGGRIDGWVFFEKLPDDLERVNLRADIEDARTGRTVAELRIPFTVEG